MEFCVDFAFDFLDIGSELLLLCICMIGYTTLHRNNFFNFFLNVGQNEN